MVRLTEFVMENRSYWAPLSLKSFTSICLVGPCRVARASSCTQTCIWAAYFHSQPTVSKATLSSMYSFFLKTSEASILASCSWRFGYTASVPLDANTFHQCHRLVPSHFLGWRKVMYKSKTHMYESVVCRARKGLWKLYIEPTIMILEWPLQRLQVRRQREGEGDRGNVQCTISQLRSNLKCWLLGFGGWTGKLLPLRRSRRSHNGKRFPLRRSEIRASGNVGGRLFTTSKSGDKQGRHPSCGRTG